MSKTNAYLLNSLLWNLREMTNLIKIMRGRIGDAKCNSWRHPLLPCGELDVLQMLEDNKNCDRYTYLLELTLDRLIYILNLMVKYLESSEVLAEFKPGKNVERPQNLSMASILCMIWDRIQAQCEARVASVKSHQSGVLTISSFTQSDIRSISLCTTCEAAQNLVTEIVLKMEDYLGDNARSSAVLSERKLMKEKLIGASNLSVMTAWVNAVLKDLTEMKEEAERFRAENVILKRAVEEREGNLVMKLKKYEEETKMLEKLCREHEDKMKGYESGMKLLRRDRQRQNEESSELRTKCTELSRNLVESEIKKKVLEEKLLKMEKSNADKCAEWKSKWEEEVKLKENAQAEAETLRNSLEETKKSIAEENSKRVAIESKTEKKIRHLTEENEKLQASLNEKQREIVKFQEKFLQAFPDLSESGQNPYKGSGDPLTDMRHQIEANQLRITQLIATNESLTQTVNRIEAVKK